MWRDPPNYWEQIVWPAYVKAHTDMLENGDLEHGKPSEKVRDMILVEGLNQNMGGVVDLICERLVRTVREA